MTARQRWLIIGGLLLCTLAAALLVDESDEPVVVQAESAPRRAAATSGGQAPGTAGARAGRSPQPDDAAPAPLAFPGMARRETSEEPTPTDPFRVKSWVLTPPPPPPPKPVAPALPFQYLGKLSEGDQLRVFLKHNDKYLIAKAGDVLNGSYAVEEIAGGRITFVYQPLNEKQQLSIGSN